MMRLAGRGVVDPVYSAICQRCSHTNVNGNSNTCNETQFLSRNMRSARYKLPSKFDDYVVKK